MRTRTERQPGVRRWRACVAALGIALVGATSGTMGQEAARHGAGPEQFGRIFDLPAFAPPTPEITAALSELGKRGGLMDARDKLSAGPIALIVDPALSAGNQDSESHSAGLTFFGQFLDHDMTFDTSSRLGVPTAPRTVRNARRPVLDLDSVYGEGPVGSPQLYDVADRAKLRVENGGRFEDLPREASGRAIIADPRNDENLIISGLHAAFLLFHNRAVDLVRVERPSWSSDDVFAEARRLTTWHYQWLLVHEFLPKIIGPRLMDEILTRGPRFYRPEQGEGFIPIEFQIAYRFGHSMVRPSYRANFTGNQGQPFFAMIFEEPVQSADPDDLRGGVRSPRRFVGWQTFFSFPGHEADVRSNKRIDTKLSTPLFDLPLGAIASGTPPTSLAQRNLLRHLTWRVPSGQAVAEEMGAPVLTDAEVEELRAIHPRFVRSTPLWYYVLREAEVFTNGSHLGPVGGRIVGEVFVGLLKADPDSYLNRKPDFTPSLGSRPGHFQITDFLTFAGVGEPR
jgi:hypothetical protein